MKNNEVDTYLKIIQVFYDAWNEGWKEHTEEGLNILSSNIEKLEKYIDTYLDSISSDDLKIYKDVVENGKYILSTATLLTCNVFK